ncbi:MAG: YtxH domain-containing protein [Deltaproteobacteria bacterium]|nr:YtxH domain-containing protein [Candidatus Anaeroferrophillacea bacterium]
MEPYAIQSPHPQAPSLAASAAAEGHSCATSHASAGQQPAVAAPANHPGSNPQPYLHDQYQYGVYGYPAAAPAAYSNAPATNTVLGMNFRDQQFWKGAAIGGGLALLLTNDAVQRTLIRGVSSVFGAARAGVEEIREKFEDIQAEIRQKATKE